MRSPLPISPSPVVSAYPPREPDYGDFVAVGDFSPTAFSAAKERPRNPGAFLAR